MQQQTFELNYTASITSDDGGFLVTFRDLSNVFTYGEIHEEAIPVSPEVAAYYVDDSISFEDSVLEKRESVTTFAIQLGLVSMLCFG